MWTLRNLIFLFSAVTILDTSTAETVICTKEGIFPFTFTSDEFFECVAWRDSFNFRFHKCLPGTYFDKHLLKCTPGSSISPSPYAVDSQEATTTIFPLVETLRNDRNTLISLDSLLLKGVYVTAQDTLQTQTLDFVSVPAIDSATQEYAHENFELLNFTISNGTDDLNTILNNGMTMDATTTTTETSAILTLCDHMNLVTPYAALIIGTPLYRPTLAYEEKFKNFALMYNGFLENTGNISIAWKNGDSIFAGIKKTIQLASQHERKFYQKYVIYKQQIPKQTSDEGIISKLQEDIRNLQEDIKGSEDVLSITTLSQVKLFLENNIKSKQQEIDRKQEEIVSSSTAALQLVELLHFLQYVKADANKVENLATHIQIRIRTLFIQYTSDISTLQNFINQINESVHFLNYEADTFETHIADNTDRQQELELRKENLNDKTIRLDAEHSENMKSVQKLQNKANGKLKMFLKKMKKVCNPEGAIKLKLKNERNPTEQEIRAACNELLEAKNVRLNIRSELDQVDQLLKENESKRNRITEILEEIDNANRELTQLVGEAPHHKSKLQEIRTEIGNLQLRQMDLWALSSRANDAVDSLSVIDETVQEVNNSFETFSKQFNILISQVHSAETDEDRLQVKDAIEEEVFEIFQKIHQLELPFLEMCT